MILHLLSHLGLSSSDQQLQDSIFKSPQGPSECPTLPPPRPEAYPHASLAAPANHCCPPKLRPLPSSMSHNDSLLLQTCNGRFTAAFPLMPDLAHLLSAPSAAVLSVGTLICCKVNITNSFKLELQITLVTPVNKEQRSGSIASSLSSPKRSYSPLSQRS